MYSGSIADITLWKTENPIARMIPRERILGDKAYCTRDRDLRIIAPFKKPIRGRFTPEQRDFNRIHRWYRASVEHLFGYLKKFAIIRDRYRGKVNMESGLIKLRQIVNVIMHTANVHFKHTPLRQV